MPPVSRVWPFEVVDRLNVHVCNLPLRPTGRKGSPILVDVVAELCTLTSYRIAWCEPL